MPHCADTSSKAPGNFTRRTLREKQEALFKESFCYHLRSPSHSGGVLCVKWISGFSCLIPMVRPVSFSEGEGSKLTTSDTDLPDENGCKRWVITNSLYTLCYIPNITLFQSVISFSMQNRQISRVSEILCKWISVIIAPFRRNAKRIGSLPFPSPELA